GPPLRRPVFRPARADREPRPRRRRLQAHQRDGALPRPVDVLRGRDPRRRPEDAPQSLRAHPRGSPGQAGRAGARDRVPQAGGRGARRGHAAARRGPAFVARPRDRAGRQAQRRHAREDDERERLPAAALPRGAAPAAAAHFALEGGAGAHREVAHRRHRGREASPRPRPGDHPVRTPDQGIRRDARARQGELPADPRHPDRRRRRRRSDRARQGDPGGARKRSRRSRGAQARAVARNPGDHAPASQAEAGEVRAPAARRQDRLTMERQFPEEIEPPKLGEGETFRGEGILAVTKALLQSGVSYVGGYQGAPVSHLLDVMVQAKDYMDELGVHVEACTSEASAAAMLGASVSYPVRGAVTWKSIVGTNVASDALSYLASAGVIGGALIVLGEDYGEGGVVAQERSHAYALKSMMWLLDPRPNLTTIANMVERGFELSEASNTPVMMELRIRACHVQGSFTARNNRAPVISTRSLMEKPADFIYERLAHPPAIFPQEKKKSAVRLPAARKYIAERKLNESFDGDDASIGIIVQGGLYNNLVRALQILELANAFPDDRGGCRIPIFALNVVYPLVPEEITGFCAGKSGVLVIEEGQPEFIEQDIATTLRRADVQTPLHGKDLLPMAGDYSTEVLVRAIARFLAQHASGVDTSAGARWLEGVESSRARAAKALG